MKHRIDLKTIQIHRISELIEIKEMSFSWYFVSFNGGNVFIELLLYN